MQLNLQTSPAAPQQSLSRLSDSIGLPVDQNLPGLGLKNTISWKKFRRLIYTPKENQSLPSLIKHLYPYLLSLLREDNA